MRDMLSEGKYLTAQPTIPIEIVIGPFLNPSNFYRTVYMNLYRPNLSEMSLLTLPHQIRLRIMAARLEINYFSRNCLCIFLSCLMHTRKLVGLFSLLFDEISAAASKNDIPEPCSESKRESL
jgi:hypothetical protein